MKSSIEWTGHTWNPIKARLKADAMIPKASGAFRFRIVPAGKVGYHCDRISEGCRNCYAEAMNRRTLPAWGTGLDYTVPNRVKVKIYLDEKVLMQPLNWREPRKVFVGSMTDVFADFVTDDMLDRLFAVMAMSERHEYQLLTKRADRMARYMASFPRQLPILGDFDRKAPVGRGNFPLLRLGFSAEDQPNFYARWEHMRKLAAAGWFTWCSYEPALGPLDVSDALCVVRNLGWLVVGGESGPGARPFNVEWARQVIAQCKAAGVPCFVKQLGAKPIDSKDGILYCVDGCNAVKLADRKGGDMAEWPAGLNVREFPAC